MIWRGTDVERSLASSEIRLGRPDRAEAFLKDTIAQQVYGPGYLAEMSIVGLAEFYATPALHECIYVYKGRQDGAGVKTRAFDDVENSSTGGDV